MPQIDKNPEKLRPFLFHGLSLEWSNASREAVGDCPFCAKESKFSVNKEDGRWRCFVCGDAGNIYGFIRKLWQVSYESTVDYESLAENRGLLSTDTLLQWGVARSEITGEWMVPGFGTDQHLNQLYKYVEIDGKFRLLPTPTLGHQIFGLGGTYDPNKSVLYICEGPWDALALWEVMSQTKSSGGKFMPTSSIESSLLSGTNIVAVPGCQTFPPHWSVICQSKHVSLLFDNDHDRTHSKTGKIIESAAYQAMRKHAGTLSRDDIPPLEIQYLQWGEDEARFNHDLPSGYDVRDFLKSAGNDLGSRINALTEILAKISPVPSEWLSGASSASSGVSSGGVGMERCETYATLVNSFRKAMKWTDGLDCALSVMLASVASTMQLGDQLWIKIIGPASCISGDTHVNYAIRDENGRIINKKGGPLERLWRRFNGQNQTGGPKWKNNVEYLIQSVTDDGVVIRNKVVDVIKKGVKPVIQFTTLSGKTMKSTGDHEILTESGWRRADSIRIGEAVYVSHGKTQKKSGRKKPAYRKELLVKTHPSPSISKKVVNGCVYCRLYIYQAVYEAHQNEIEYSEYVERLNSGDIDGLWYKPNECEIHHADGNPLNNSIDNLVMVQSSSEHHLKFHAEESTPRLAINMELDEVVAIRDAGKETVYDVVCADPYRNFVAGGIVVHNCGKSTLCEAVSTNKNFILAKSTLRGFFSGYNNGEAGGEDFSLLSQAKGKTLIIKDGDTLLKSPNRDEILSQARDIYDTVSRTSFKNKASKDYEGYRMTMILCGTSSLRELDSSELGERFLDCVIMHGINDELEDEILWRVVNKSCRNVCVEAGEKDPETRQDEETTEMMRLTAGYVEYLRKNASQLLSEVSINDEYLQLCTRLGKFVAFMRARPSRSQDEVHEREFAARLVIQLSRLAMCLAAVLNRKEVDEEVMRRVKKVAMDTGRGISLKIVEAIYRAGERGLLLSNVASSVNLTEDRTRRLLMFMRQLGIIKTQARKVNNIRQQTSYVLSPLMYELYYQVTGEEFENDE